MSDKPVINDIANELGKKRNRAAVERTLMAWIRTALSLIGFGFGIGKLAAYLEAAGLHPPATLPTLLWSLGRALLSSVFSVCSPP